MPTENASQPVLVLVGPTAIGKTALSLRIAAAFDCEIISMDSMQVYRGMDIGTAKASPEEQAQVRHHLLDIVNPDEQYNAARFVADAQAAMTAIRGRGKIPLLVGGTGLYLKALTQGLFEAIAIPPAIRAELRSRLERGEREALFAELAACDPQSAARIHINDTQRLLRGLELFRATGLPWSEHLARQQEQGQKALCAPLLLGLHCERALLYERIRLRTQAMMQQPFRQEVEKLLTKGYSVDLPSMQALGYRHMVRHLAGEWTLTEATETLARDTCRYAKRQLTWFRHAGICWFDRDNTEDLFPLIERFVQERPLPPSR